jgi:D-alanyl-D-alanine carboxypeptidase/D-alanyl-D-alanine-endopeptidase (penicillin-binding protein 4)
MTQNSKITRRLMLAGMAAGIAVPGCAEAPKSSIRPAGRPSSSSASTSGAVVRGDIAGSAALVDAAKLGGVVGFVVAETASGKVLESMNAAQGQPPASVAKAMTALYGFDRLGAGHRFATSVIATGPVSGGRVQGDLILAGSGDPTLDTDRLGDLAAALAAKGIKEVSGRYLAFAGGVPKLTEIDREQPDYVGYNPAISGLNLNFNRVNFEWKRGGNGYQLGFDARGKRFVPPVAMATIKTVDRDLPLFAYKRGDVSDNWTVSARALGKNGSRWLPVRHPEIYTAEVFATLLRAHGIKLNAAQIATSLPRGTVLAQVQSDSLTEVMRDMLRFSTNITAEVVGLSSSGAASLAASGAAMSAWAGGRFGVSARYVDHSGLGGDSRISASDMVTALRASRNGGLPGILREQGMRDEKGKEIKNHPVRVMAKTGTLNFVSGLAGYIMPPSGKELTFAIFSADTRRRDALREAEREQPEGGPQWTRRARTMQSLLINRWAGLYL